MSIFNKKQSKMPRRRLSDYDDENTNNISSAFKRNRTLTGTTSNQLNSVNSKSDLESPRVHSHNLTVQRRKVFSTLLVVFVSVALIWTVISQLVANVAVTIPDIATLKTGSISKYEEVIQDYLDLNPTNRLLFLLDQSALTNFVSNKLPEVSYVSYKNMISIGKAKFTVIMRKPVAGWQINGKQYYVDSSGIPFEKNYYSSSIVQIVDESGVTLKSGNMAIASKRFLAFVGRVVYLARQSGYTVIKASLPVNTTRELEVGLKEGGYTVKLSIDRPAGEQVEDMIRAVRYFANLGQVPTYIDVRVNGKAFYK